MARLTTEVMACLRQPIGVSHAWLAIANMGITITVLANSGYGELAVVHIWQFQNCY